MSDPRDRPGYSFDPGPPPEASRFLRNKGLRPGFAWEDVEPEEHAVAFTVAKAMELDLLEAMKREVQRAIDEGLPFEAFQRNWRANPRLADWWGKRDVIDPVTGETVEAQLGSPRRLRTIYDANLRSARAAGQWERIQRTKAAFPYLEYTLGASEVHRPAHAAHAGMILPVDSPFWDAWMPPNGWGCRCKVRPVTKAEARRRGVSDEPDVPTRMHLNLRTGEERRVPVGVDPGWDRNPGKLRLSAMQDLLAERLTRLPEEVMQAAVRDIAGSWQVERLLEGRSPNAVPIAVFPSDLAEQLGSATRLVRMGAEYARKFVQKERRVTTATVVELADALAGDGIVYASTVHDPTELTVVSRSARPWVYVMKVMQSKGEVWVKTFKPAKKSTLGRLDANPDLIRLK